MAKTSKAAPRRKVRDAAESTDEFDDSDALDDSDTEKKQKKRKRASTGSEKKARSPRKKKKVADSDDELDDGVEIVGAVVQAPKTGRVPPGQVSPNTFDFLTQLRDPKCNDREWFKLHDPVYRQAEQEWKDFIEAFTDLLVEIDDQIPPLPPKDVIHRIYRDTRFSNDKTPYKTNFSASFSRSGRKGIYAFYHVMIRPGNQSMIAAGAWCPGKNELELLRSNIKRDPSRLRDIINGAAFVKHFGKAEPGARRNIFGREDELKVAPKGVAKTHPDIDLLKCRSFAVSHQFTDAQVLDPDFKSTAIAVARISVPFVHCLNELMTIPPDEDEDNE
ncbi:hypothetical protein MKEN_00258700 [Mycena kentingensis (nom. inval.)]|nr:hypothetical protein MKEN_00258700 [Mycena kentingensis (nom. inval.)]